MFLRKTTITFSGVYRNGKGQTGAAWAGFVASHEGRFPTVCDCFPGTFALELAPGIEYAPPDDAVHRQRAKDSTGTGHHIAPRAKVKAVNFMEFEAWLYRGDHANNVVELIARDSIAQRFGLEPGDRITVVITEYSEVTPEMPAPP